MDGVEGRVAWDGNRWAGPPLQVSDPPPPSRRGKGNRVERDLDGDAFSELPPIASKHTLMNGRVSTIDGRPV